MRNEQLQESFFDRLATAFAIVCCLAFLILFLYGSFVSIGLF